MNRGPPTSVRAIRPAGELLAARVQIEEDRPNATVAALPRPNTDRRSMPLYLGRFSYTSEATKALARDPQDRSKAAAEAAESLGGKLVGFWFAFGEFDGVFLMDAPDNATAAALAMVVGGSGALSKLETTVLLDMQEAQEAMRKAGAASYRPPS
jgi:uncharacterized protein with GYD domain